MRIAKSRLFAVAVATLAIFSLGCSKQIDQLKARNALNKGVQAFQGSDYPTAAERFAEATQLDPTLIDAKAYEAYSYMMQYIPGSEFEENDRIAERAIGLFMEVLQEDETNMTAVSSLASLYFNMKDFDKAIEWHNRRIELDPTAADSYYTIGVISWTRSYEPRLKARADLGMNPEDPGPIKDKEKRAELAETTGPVIAEGLESLEKAIEINPDYSDAMAYVNLLYRERADLAETPEEYEQMLASADEWVQRTLDTKKRIAEAGTIDQFREE